jgi:hypothetical protein
MVIISDPGGQAGTIHSKRKNRPSTQPRERITGVRVKKMLKRTRTTDSKRRMIVKMSFAISMTHTLLAIDVLK